MNSTKQKLMDLLKSKLHIYVDGDATAYIEDSDYEEAATAILKLIEEIVPEEDFPGMYYDDEKMKQVFVHPKDWNSCCQTMRERLKEIG